MSPGTLNSHVELVSGAKNVDPKNQTFWAFSKIDISVRYFRG